MKNRIAVILLILIAILMVTMCLCFPKDAYADEEPIYLYVTCNQLYGRATPSKNGIIESLFEKGDRLVATGKWSKDKQWVEVVGGEAPTVWVCYKYVTERVDPFHMKPIYYGRLKIRSKPFKGRTTGYLKDTQIVEIDQVVLGWGHCSKGWIDLDYLIEIKE